MRVASSPKLITRWLFSFCLVVLWWVFSGQAGADVDIGYRYDPATGALSGVTTAGGATGTWSNFDPVTGRGRNFTLGPLSTTTAWDGLGRVTSHSTKANGITWTFTYSYDADGHCYQAATPNGTWTYGFDNSTGWIHTAALSSGPNFTYNFDEAGRPAGATDFRPTVRRNGAEVIIFGSVTPQATVNIKGPTLPTEGVQATVNSTTGQFSVTLTGIPAGWQVYTVRGTLPHGGTNGTDAVADQVSQVFVPPVSESLGYDTSGNRNVDARWASTWDLLDRLSTILETNPYAAGSATRLDFLYDLQGRRIQKTVSVNGVVTKRTTTLWDGWKPVMEIDYTGSVGVETVRRYYTWGLDVSNTFYDAAGIGGLLEIVELRGNTVTGSLPVYDGIGNIVALVDAVTGQQVAAYQYGPFGEVLGEYGPRAANCPFRYQTRLYDSETSLCYFGARYYDPKTQTWLSRDPLREDGGINLYAYCQDDPVGNFDPIGEADDSVLGTVDRLIQQADRAALRGSRNWKRAREQQRQAKRETQALQRWYNNQWELAEEATFGRFEGGPGETFRQLGLGMLDPVMMFITRPDLTPRSFLQRAQMGEFNLYAMDPTSNPRFLGNLAGGELLGGGMTRMFGAPVTLPLVRLPAASRAAPASLGRWLANADFLREMETLQSQWPSQMPGFVNMARRPITALDVDTILLQEHLNNAVARFEAEGYTAAQAAKIAEEPWRAAMYRGSQIDSFFKESVILDLRLSHLEVTPRFEFGADVYNPETLRWWDVTTPGEWNRHVQKYWLFEDGVPLFTK